MNDSGWAGLFARGAALLRRNYPFLAVVTGSLLFVTALPGLLAAMRRTPWDLNVDYLSARAFLQHYSPFTDEGAIRSGVSIAGVSGFGHPPTTSFWALPLAGLEIHTAGRVVGWVTLACVLVEAFVISRLLLFPAPLATAWLIAGYLSGCPLVWYHVGLGQISGLIAFLIFLGWWAGRQGKDLIAGIALGAACTLKLFPNIMVVFLVVTRRWRAVAGAMAFRPVCVPHGPVMGTAMAISIGISLVLLSVALWLVWTSRATDKAFDLFFALFVSLSVLTSQWVWEHYALLYLLPAFVVASELRKRSREHGAAGTVAMTVGLAAVVASWRVDINKKQDLQRAVLAGRSAFHLQLHVADLVNWVPGLVLLSLLLSIAPFYRRQTREARRESRGI